MPIVPYTPPLISVNIYSTLLSGDGLGAGVPSTIFGLSDGIGIRTQKGFIKVTLNNVTTDILWTGANTSSISGGLDNQPEVATLADGTIWRIEQSLTTLYLIQSNQAGAQLAAYNFGIPPGATTAFSPYVLIGGTDQNIYVTGTATLNGNKVFYIGKFNTTTNTFTYAPIDTTDAVVGSGATSTAALSLGFGSDGLLYIFNSTPSTSTTVYGIVYIVNPATLAVTIINTALPSIYSDENNTVLAKDGNLYTTANDNNTGAVYLIKIAPGGAVTSYTWTDAGLNYPNASGVGTDPSGAVWLWAGNYSTGLVTEFDTTSSTFTTYSDPAFATVSFLGGGSYYDTKSATMNILTTTSHPNDTVLRASLASPAVTAVVSSNDTLPVSDFLTRDGTTTARNIVLTPSVTYDRLYTDHFCYPPNCPQPIYIDHPAPGSFFCENLPPIQNLQQVQAGSQGYADNLIGYNFVAYKGTSVGDVHGLTNTAVTSGTWTPPVNSQPFNFALRKDPTQDIFHPAFNVFNNQFGIAWIETSHLGILKLQYAEYPISKMKTFTNIRGNDLYVYPNINPTYRSIHKENIPYNKITIINNFDERFPLSSYQYNVGGHGFNVGMNGIVEAVRFVQTFRQAQTTLNVRLVTAPTLTQAEGYIASQPIPGYPVNIYYGETNKVFRHMTTGENGTFSCLIPAGLFTFEILTLNDSIVWQQRLV